MKKLILVIVAITAFSCNNSKTESNKSEALTAKSETETVSENVFPWEAANIYFLLTDRFNNADTSNDLMYGRQDDAAVLRGYKGGDLKGVTQKINEGYFTDLGINAIWMTPIVEQIHGSTDEGTGKSYGFHGYWTKDWTAIDANLGTREDLKALVDAAHSKGIRVVLDAVINHTGPVTEKDPVWPGDWVRTEPQCEYTNYENTTSCTLVKNLPDIRTDSNENVELPPQLVAKWKAEGRYEQEVKELDAFFERTGHPRAPRFYIMKWLTDYITDFGIDGYRCDTVKHTEPYVWQEFKTECDYAFAQYKANNPEKVLDDTNFYLVGEIYNYGISGGKLFDFGDKKVNFYDDKFSSQINFEFKWNAKQMPANDVFKKYDDILQNELKGYSVLNYMSSHDDGQPFDKTREKPYETATLLFLTLGASQVYYGDEIARELIVDGATGDANLRSLMDWDKATNNPETQKILTHWQKLGQFTATHPAVGAGKHQLISDDNGLIFSRVRENDKIIAGINLSKGEKSIKVSSIFEDGTNLKDFYSGKEMKVENGAVTVDSPFDIVLLEEK
ncbi:alpha-amylase family glycosyl hydrolase [Winogradskyella jejuensis]|uniref:Alpha-amylase n=1 Tax=Winogradskyella jejuensis TaxID=1089305 RepID=A0A1M5PD40_9FLAO|nr:alpha-amylase family glycosyl hydrolase [Winogradskyella jejuensis]SHG99173.1 alpha-amylase [Winogradskyella jejuensis]